MARGRPRNTTTPREPNGQAKRTKKADTVHPEAMIVRMREVKKAGVDPDEWKDQLAGFSLGQLRLRGRAAEKKRTEDPLGISQEQYEAGMAWARTVHRHASIMGYRFRVRSPGFHLVAAGTSTGGGPEPDEIARIRKRYRAAYDALARAANDHGYLVQLVTWSICVESAPVSELTPNRARALKIGLNALK